MIAISVRRICRLALVLAFFCLVCRSLRAAELNYHVSWIGNSYSGKTQWVLQDVEGMWVAPDGTVFTNVHWDENGGNVEEFRDGKLLGYAGHTHGWGYEGGDAVAANSKYLFIVQTVSNERGGLKGNSWPAKGFTWSGVSRRLRSDIKKAAPFEGGHGKEGDVLQGAFLPIAEFEEKQPGKIRGLWEKNAQLLVSVPLENKVIVYDSDTMKLQSSWAIDRPDRLCIDRRDTPWVLQTPIDKDARWKLTALKRPGLPEQSFEFPAGVVPTALAVDADNRLLIADAGPDQQIKIYGDLDKEPTLKDTFGFKGGIFAGPTPGKFGDRRFNNPTAVGCDREGNIYVASSGSTAGGSTVLESYSSGGKLRWRQFGLNFIDLADIDPASENDVYTKEEHFKMDWEKPAGQEWSYAGYTVNPQKYPDDPRLHLKTTHVWLRRLDGKPFLFLSDMTGDFLHVYRFDPKTDGETAIPYALLSKKHVATKDSFPPHQPAKGQWMWIDRNSDGKIDADEIHTIDSDAGGIPTPDERGNIWYAERDRICCLPCIAFTGLMPFWDLTEIEFTPKPTELDTVRRLKYLPKYDAMLMAGNAGDDHNQHWKPMGPVLVHYDIWSHKGGKLRWKIVLPYEKGAQGHESSEPISFDTAGDYIFVAYTRGLKADGVKSAYVKVYSLLDGKSVGNLVAEKELGETGLLDIVDSVRAAKRPNGEYVVFLEDDAKAKVVMFRWTP